MKELILSYIFFILLILISVAFLTLFERKMLSYMQLRKGPNKLGFKGLLQPISDALKLLMKEFFFLNFSNIYFFSPMIMFFLSLMLWFIYPWINQFYYINNSMIYLMLILSLMVYPILLIGWVSFCNYSILGSLRAISQMISFEVLLFLMFFMMMMMIESYNMYKFNDLQMNIKFLILLYPLYLIFLISLLIDLNRVPFDLIEGESELVSGFNIEYFSSMFVLIFLSEYMNIMFMSMLLTIMFYGLMNWSICFIFIYMSHMIFLIMIRGVLPRIRYDKLMKMCWTELLVLILMYLFFIYLFKEMILIIFN
uniref:NADH-ubiquinone oxidoreductase chain 1 n=1 Tax=Bombus filchnerae TaxID=395525 RepID=A0A8E5HHS6_9HYME|nr:NADH dehydrogenase subunit 1 [Bombus filchnerae]QTZ18846.1 NADH dehydrogenase subunit 1 [Bombus filchnerae]WKW52613.1 NADH dehydrogenase subunit 1 [Bombus filchnerae]